MENIFETNKQINAKIGADTGGVTTFELVKAQVAKLGGDTSKVVDIYTGEQQVLEHISAGPAVNIQNNKDVAITENGTTVVSPDEGYDAIKDVVVDVNVAGLSAVKLHGNLTNKDTDVITFPELVSSIEGILEFPEASYVCIKGVGLTTIKGIIANNATGIKLKNNTQLKNIQEISTSNKLLDCSYMFDYCSELTTVPLFDTSNVTNMYSMFDWCEKLTEVPAFNTSNVTNMYGMFYACKELITVSQLNASNATNINDMFKGCTALTNFGGMLNVGQAFTAAQTFYLNEPKLLSDESIQNVIDGLYDMTSKSFTPTLMFHSTVYAKLTDVQKQQITAKNWTVTSA